MFLSKIALATFAQSKYIIHKGRYLIEAPPQRTPAAFILFSNDLRKESPDMKFIEIAKLAGEKWSNLESQKKQKYFSQANQLSEKRSSVMQSYEKKFVLPFKKVNYSNLLARKAFASLGNTVKEVQEMGKVIQQAHENLSESEKNKLMLEAESINSQREVVIKNYRIPATEFKTFDSYFRSQQRRRKLGKKKDISKAEMDQMKAKFNEELKAYEQEFESFAQKFGLSNKQLKKMIQKAEKKIMKQKEAKSEEKA